MSLFSALGFAGCLLMGHDWAHVKRTPNWDYYKCRECDMRRKEPR